MISGWRRGIRIFPGLGLRHGRYEASRRCSQGAQSYGQEAATSNEHWVDFGSPQANAAVKKLEKLGAIVYPPGNKDSVDWGLLAGTPPSSRFPLPLPGGWSVYKPAIPGCQTEALLGQDGSCG
jgi:hypothetical protein